MSGFSTTNPKNESLIDHYEYLEPRLIASVITASSVAFESWSRSPLIHRLQVVQTMAELLLAQKTQLAGIATDEMGKPLTQSEAEIEKCAVACRYYAEQAERMLADEVIPTQHAKSYVSYQPLGPILAIMPWNFPFWQVIRCAVPALCAGNTVLLKHADNTTGCALALEQLILQAGAPSHVFRALIIDHSRAESVITDPRVRAVSLTGSEKAGSAVAALAGQHLKKTVLELGGSDPYVVLRDADIELAATLCSKARFINNGQSCIAAKRFIIEAPVYEAFVAAFNAKAAALRVGDPRLATTDIGPLAKRSAVHTLERQVGRSLDLGARLLLGGKTGTGSGYYYPPTVLGEVTPEMPVFAEEVFGPVAPMIKARDEEEALALAANSAFGLGGAIFSRDAVKAEHLARERFACGSVAVNGMVVSDPRLPFGGLGNSGYGRELAEHGLREFVNIKSITVA